MFIVFFLFGQFLGCHTMSMSRIVDTNDQGLAEGMDICSGDT